MAVGAICLLIIETIVTIELLKVPFENRLIENRLAKEILIIQSKMIRRLILQQITKSLMKRGKPDQIFSKNSKKNYK